MRLKSMYSRLMTFLGLSFLLKLNNTKDVKGFDSFINSEGNRRQRRNANKNRQAYGRKQVIAANPSKGTPERVIYHRDPVHSLGLAKIMGLQKRRFVLAGLMKA